MKDNIQIYDLSQFKLIGKIQISISKSKTLDEALHACLSIVLEECKVDYAVVWLFNNETNSLRPYISIFPMDITYMSYGVGEGYVGKVYQSRQAIRVYSDELKTYDEQLLSDKFESEAIVPLEDKTGMLGCIQFMNKKGNASMTNDIMDILDIMANIIGFCISDNENIDIPWKMNDIIIHVKDLVKKYKNGEDEVTCVLKGVNLNIYEGEFLVLLGESGCGKSTLLNIIGGIDDATSGDVYYKDFCVTKANIKELTNYRRDNIGFIFQSYNLMPNLNAIENIELISEGVQNPIDSIEALKMVKLEEKADKYPSQLSGGQQQRVSIARALAKNPNIIIADEPTAALDYETSVGVLSAMKELTKNGVTMIMVTHNEEIAKMADRVVKLRDGLPYKISINRNPKNASELVW